MRERSNDLYLKCYLPDRPEYNKTLAKTRKSQTYADPHCIFSHKTLVFLPQICYIVRVERHLSLLRTIWRGIEEVITGLTRKRLGFVPRYCVKALVFSQMLRFPAVFATLACRKRTDHLSVFYQSSHKNQIRRGIEEVITGLTRNQFA